jgi:hypothetical protein
MRTEPIDATTLGGHTMLASSNGTATYGGLPELAACGHPILPIPGHDEFASCLKQSD